MASSLLYSGFRTLCRPLYGHGLGKIKPLYRIYQGIVKRSIPEGERTVEVNGYTMRINLSKTRDMDGIAQRLVFDKAYEPWSTQVVKDTVKHGQTCVDIGANIGYYTLLLSQLVGECGHVFAFEPEPRNCAELKANLALNEINNVEVIEKAVSDKDGAALLYVSQTESGEHSLVKGRNASQMGISIPVRRLDSVVIKADFVKMDVEGHEIEAIYGGRDVLNSCESMLIEFWPDGIKIAGHTIGEYWQALADVGFTHIYLVDDFAHKVTLTDIHSAIGYTVERGYSANLLCTKHKREDYAN